MSGTTCTRLRYLFERSLLITTAGLVSYFERDYDAAIPQYLKALELDSNFAIAHYFLGQAYLEKNMFDEAVAELREVVAVPEVARVAEDGDDDREILVDLCAQANHPAEPGGDGDGLDDRLGREVVDDLPVHPP